MRGFFVLLLTALWTLTAFPAGAESAGSLARKGKQQERYMDAIDAYRQALAIDPTSGILQYNLGTAYAKKGDLDEARSTLEQAAQAPQSPRQPDAYFNLGVAFAQKGIDESGQADNPPAPAPAQGRGQGSRGAPPGPDLSPAIDHLGQGLQSFRQSILADPKDSEAKYNYEVTKELLKKLKQQQQQQQQQQQNQNGQPNQDQQNQQNQNDQQNQNQQDQNQQNQNGQPKDSSNNPGSDAKPTPTAAPTPRATPHDPGSNPQDSQDNSGDSKPEPLTPEQMDAQRTLNLLEADKPDQFKKLFQFHGPKDRTLDKDW